MKPWYKSRVIWFNALAGGAAFVASVWPILQNQIPTWAYISFGAVVAAVNIGLRFITSDPVTSRQMDDRDA